MLRSIDKVTIEYQHPCIAGNCRVYKYLLRRSAAVAEIVTTHCIHNVGFVSRFQ